MMCSSMLTAVLVAQLCINPSWAERRSEGQVLSDSKPHAHLATHNSQAQLLISGSQEMASASRGEGAANGEVLKAILPHTKVLDAQSRLAVENSTALLGVNQILEASGLVLKKQLDIILELALSNLTLKGEEQGEKGCEERKDCPFTGTVTIQHDGVTVGCVEHSSRLSSDTFYATGVILKLEVDLHKLEVAGVKVDGHATAVANMPHITLQIRCDESGCKAHMAIMATKTWSLEVTCFKNHGGMVGAVVEACTRLVPASRQALGNWLLGLLKQKIIDAIQAAISTDNMAAQAAKAAGNVVHHLTKLATGKHKPEHMEC